MATGQANAAANLEAIETGSLGFQAFASNNRIRLLPKPWPAEQYPSTTASLLSVAPGKGLLAAAGPDALVIATTESVRQALSSNAKEKTKEQFTPQATIQVPRVSQVTFSSDESCLVISAEEGGGLAVYDTNGLSGGAQPAFQIPTNGVAVRHILANPSKDNSHQFALVLANGQLLLADLKQRQLVNGVSGSPVLKENVSCACWSKLGKQIVAGLADGTAVQLDVQGNTKAVLPKPPQLLADRDPQEQSLPVTAIYWLETFDFLMIHAPINAPGSELPDDAAYHLVHRDKASGSCSYHQFDDPCFGSMGATRVPVHHFIQRLREWPPSLDDTLILSSTTSVDIGMITRSQTALAQEPAVTHTYTTTVPLEDTRRANLPTSESGDDSDTSVVGMSLDLSVKEKVPMPIPGDDEIFESSTPLPALFVLNHEGVLCAWHVVYHDSVRQKVAYPGLVSADVQQSEQQSTQQSAQQQTPSASNTATAPFGTPAPAQAQTPAQPAFGQASTPAFGSSSKIPTRAAFGQASTPAFGSASKPGQPAFGQSSTPAAFGGAAKPAQPAFGQSSVPTLGGKPAFGAPTGFGTSGGMGANKPSPWGTPAATSSSPAAQNSSVFGGNKSGESPFASFNKQSQGDNKPSAFASAAASNGAQTKPSAFGSIGLQSGDGSKSQSPAPSAFGQPSGMGGNAQSSIFASYNKSKDEGQKASPSPFSGMGSAPSAFGTNKNNNNNQMSSFSSTGQQSSFGMSNGQSFGSTVTLNSNPGSFSSGGGVFGSGAKLGKTSFGQPSKEQETADSRRTNEDKPSTGLGSLSGFKIGSSFKPDGSAKDDLPKPPNPGGSMFGNGFANSLSAAGQNSEPKTPIKEEADTGNSPKLDSIPAASTTPASPPKQPQKKPEKDFAPPGLLTPQATLNEVSKQLPSAAQDDAPLPPDFVNSKPKKEESPAANDAPLPPDFLNSKSQKEPSPAPADDAPLPPDFLSSKSTKPTDASDVPIAGSPPLDVGNERFSDSEAEGPPEENEEPDWSDEEGDESEEQSQYEEEEDDQTLGSEQLSSPQAGNAPESPQYTQQQQQQSTTPPTDFKKASYTPAGFPGFPKPHSAFKPPPQPHQSSPRSPSPVRGSSKAPHAQQAQPPQYNKTTVPPAKPVERPAPQQKAPTPQPPTQAELEDQEDARIKAILAAPIEPSQELPEFIAHRDYKGVSDKPGVAGSIEKVYRDANSMVDTFGLNARSLQSFIDGNRHGRDENDAMKSTDMDNERNWVFGELDGLRLLIDGIGKDLEKGRVEDPTARISDCLDEEKQLQTLANRASEMKKQIHARTDPRQQAEHYHSPLPSESAAQLSELRQQKSEMQRQLAEAEQALSILRADLASVPADGQKGPSNVPTLEAVTNTILKMTAQIEQRSGDVDVLERRIRRLPQGLAALHLDDDYEDDLIGAMHGSKLLAASTGSPMGTPRPATRKARMAANGDPLGMSGMFGSRYMRTPPAAGRRSVADLGASGLGRSTASFGASTRKKMNDVSVQEAEGWLRKDKHRRGVLRNLKEHVERRGVKEIRAEK